MDCKFVVGQKVVCVTNEDWFNIIERNHTVGPKSGDVCTITLIAERYSQIVLQFKEWPSNNGYTYKAFRALEDRRSERGMEVLRKILRDAKVGDLVKDDA